MRQISGSRFRPFPQLPSRGSFLRAPEFGDVYRAEALFRLGCVRFRRSQVAAAVSLFTLALQICDRAGQSDRLRTEILRWRSQRQ